MSASISSDNFLSVPGPPPPPRPLTPDSYGSIRDTDTPIVIDNGATNLRWGFATSETPRCQPNVITKYRERKTNRPLLLFGDAVEVEGGAKAQARTPWEGDVLLNFDALENALDYAFLNLGIDTETITHPVLMSERIATPSHSRSLTSELLFEQYSVPSLTYCVDGLMSLYQNNTPQPSQPYAADGLVISFNTASTSVIPVLDGRGIMSHAKRIPWSTSQAYDYLQKLIQLKYPSFPSRISTSHASTKWMFQNICEFAPDYTELLRKLRDPLQMRAHERIIQFPFSTPIESEKTEEELARIAERRKEQGRRLQEMAAKQRMEKLLQKENDLVYLTTLKENKVGMRKADWLTKLEAEGFDDESSLDDTIKKLDASVKKGRKKEASEGDDVAEEPSFPLADVPDDQLDEDGLKEKKRQRLMKAGFEARMRARREKEREKAQREDELRREQEEREQDLRGWVARVRAEHEGAMEKLRDRKRRKAAMSDRKSATAQARMKTIANLASEGPTGKKRRKASGEDMFGANDDDWAVYRKINTAAPSSDEEDDLAQLHTLETKLLAYDPTFTTSDTFAGRRSALIAAFRPDYNDDAGQCRVHLSVERWRVCEPWFSPSTAGVDTAGLGEVLAGVLGNARFSEQEKARLVGNVFLTGTPAQIPGLAARLNATIRPIMDPDAGLRIVHAADVGIDAWRGMRAFANSAEGAVARCGVSRAEYDEWGGERIRRWWGGNWNWAV